VRITAPSDVGNVVDLENMKRFVAAFLDQTKTSINGGISTDNLRCAVIDSVFTASGIEVALKHNLGVVPQGYFKLKGPNVTIYDGDTAATEQNIYVKSTGAGTVKILVLG
jgi:hypothetical protein